MLNTQQVKGPCVQTTRSNHLSLCETQVYEAVSQRRLWGPKASPPLSCVPDSAL